MSFDASGSSMWTKVSHRPGTAYQKSRKPKSQKREISPFMLPFAYLRMFRYREMNIQQPSFEAHAGQRDKDTDRPLPYSSGCGGPLSQGRRWDRTREATEKNSPSNRVAPLLRGDFMLPAPRGFEGRAARCNRKGGCGVLCAPRKVLY